MELERIFEAVFAGGVVVAAATLGVVAWGDRKSVV